MIRNIIFDMGQVLIRWEPAKLLKHFSLTPEDEALLLREMFLDVEWVQLDRGVISGEQAARQICARVPAHLHETVHSCVKEWFTFYLEPIPGMAELVAELAGKGYGIYLLSNATTALRGYFPRIPGSEYFQGLMVSGEEKLLKPQHEIYEALYDRFGLKPEECFFMDDNPSNVEGAILTGMQAAVFRADASAIRAKLHEAGVNISC